MTTTFKPKAMVLLMTIAGSTVMGSSHAQDVPACRAAAKADVPAPITTNGKVLTRSGKKVAYTADVGLLRVRGGVGADGDASATATMSYYAYVAKGVPSTSRPLVFLWDGGPGASTRPMLMNSFGPVAYNLAALSDHRASGDVLHANLDTLLDVADLVFVDAPGTGFGRVEQCDTDKSFYGIDADAAVFQRVIAQFRAQHHREASPLYLVGESYGTTRAAVVAGGLEKAGVRVSGVVLISQDLDLSTAVADGFKANIGNDYAAFLTFPTYAATAWFHGKVAHDGDFESRQRAVERFALDVYGPALLKGNVLPEGERQALVEKLAFYSGLSKQTWLDGNLRIEETRFRELLKADAGRLIGREDARVDGPAPKVPGRATDDDPTGKATQEMTSKAFDSYVRGTLRVGDMPFNPYVDVHWDMHHVTDPRAWVGTYVNTAPDLIGAMTSNSRLRVLITGGYYDLATPYFNSPYLISHLPVSSDVAQRIEWKVYAAPHSVYKMDEARRDLHDRIARMIGH